MKLSIEIGYKDTKKEIAKNKIEFEGLWKYEEEMEEGINHFSIHANARTDEVKYINFTDRTYRALVCLDPEDAKLIVAAVNAFISAAQILEIDPLEFAQKCQEGQLALLKREIMLEEAFKKEEDKNV